MAEKMQIGSQTDKQWGKAQKHSRRTESQTAACAAENSLPKTAFPHMSTQDWR